MKKSFNIILILAIIIIFPACKKQESTPDSKEPISLSFAALGEIPNDLKNRLINKFPQITFTFQPIKIKGIEELVSANQTPDIVLDIDRLTVPAHLLSEIQFDLTPLITMNNMNIDRFEPGLINHIKAYGNNDKIYALPYERLFNGLFYNKNVFDSLNIAYPKDGMDWNETIELSKRLTQKVNGTAYRGLDPLVDESGLLMLMDQFSLNLVNGKTDKAQLLSGSWKSMLQLVRGIYKIPGNLPDPNKTINYKDFTDTGKVAMALGAQLELLTQAKISGQNVDLVTFPTLIKGQQIGPGSRTANLMITSACKHKDIAFQVISYLVSDEVQLENSKIGVGSSLKDKNILKAFATNIPEAKGKNVQALYANQLSPVSDISNYEETAFLATGQMFKDFFDNDKNLDSILETANNRIDQAIIAEKNLK